MIERERAIEIWIDMEVGLPIGQWGFDTFSRRLLTVWGVRNV